jgi:hypothetical protein
MKSNSNLKATINDSAHSRSTLKYQKQKAQNFTSNKNTAYYVDPNKLNQNKFLSVTGHPTWAPERLNKNKVDAVVIASGWEHDVRNQIQSVLKYKADTIGFSDLLR